MKILLLVAALVCMFYEGETLSCHSCPDTAKTEEECNQSGEVKCETGNACYAIKGGLQGEQFVVFRKGCTNMDQCLKVKDEQPCDDTQLHWACVDCCQTDGCNRVAPTPP